PSDLVRGEFVALGARAGEILCRPCSRRDNGGVPGGYAGATMFSPPAVDVDAGLVYGTFVQPYTEPAAVTACHAAASGGFSGSCERPGSFLKSVVAFDMKTGEPRWPHALHGHHPRIPPSRNP